MILPPESSSLLQPTASSRTENNANNFFIAIYIFNKVNIYTQFTKKYAIKNQLTPASVQSIVRWNILEIPVTIICIPTQNVIKATSLFIIILPELPRRLVRTFPFRSIQ